MESDEGTFSYLRLMHHPLVVDRLGGRGRLRQPFAVFFVELVAVLYAHLKGYSCNTRTAITSETYRTFHSSLI